MSLYTQKLNFKEPYLGDNEKLRFTPCFYSYRI